jgi:hypothetical protein
MLNALRADLLQNGLCVIAVTDQSVPFDRDPFTRVARPFDRSHSCSRWRTLNVELGRSSSVTARLYRVRFQSIAGGVPPSRLAKSRSMLTKFWLARFVCGLSGP